MLDQTLYTILYMLECTCLTLVVDKSLKRGHISKKLLVHTLFDL